MRAIVRVFLGLVVLTLISSCSFAPKKRPPQVAGPDAKKELSQAQIEVAAGADKKALARLKRIVTQHPETDAADDAYMMMGRLYFKNRDYEASYQSFMAIVNSDVFSPSEGEALLSAAKALTRIGRLDEALALTKKSIAIPGLSQELRLENYKIRFSILSELGDRLDALRALVYLAENEPDEKNKETHRIRALDYVESRLSDSELSTVAKSREFGFARGPAMFRYASLMFEQRDFWRAREAFSDVLSLMPETERAEQSKNYIAQIDARRTVDPRTVGLVLPLTGRQSSVAYRTLRGVQLGLGVYGKERSGLKLAVIDSEGNSDVARKAVERLVTEDNVIALIGSLLSRTAVAVASKADELGVPSIALSQRAGLTEVGETVFRNAMTSEMQVRHLVHTAMSDLGIRRFAILYPNDPYGVEYANLFWDEVLARGGQVRGAQTYANNETDFSGPIRRLTGTYYLEDRQEEYKGLLSEWRKKAGSLTARTNPPEDLLPPIVDFEAVFVPDGTRALSQIAPSLNFFNIKDLRLLGTNLWNSESISRSGEKSLENTVFIDSVLTSDPAFRNSKFFLEYKAIFGEEPGLFEAQGYDAALAIRQILASGERSRDGVAKRLKSLRNFHASVGTLEMNEFRELSRPLVALTLHSGKILRLADVPPKAPEAPPKKAAPTKKRGR